jgi:hypothetical protein
MSGTAWKEGAPRAAGAGRERKSNNTSSAILDHRGLGFKGRRDPDRFHAAALARVLRRAGFGDAAAHVDHAYGLRWRTDNPACTCFRGMVRVAVECPACRGFRTGMWS